jgi:hypothetical protein
LKFVKRSSIVWALAIAVTGAAAIRAVDVAWRRMESGETGKARWIWATWDDVKTLQTPHPVLFRASKSIRIDRRVERARAKIFAGPTYRLFVDGVLVAAGGQKPGDPLDVVDLPNGLAAGNHEIEIEAASASGVGGVLFSLDLSDYGRNAVVSDGSWKVGDRPVWVWGEPPMYPWRFPRLPKP